jgi:hypothetical protein
MAAAIVTAGGGVTTASSPVVVAFLDAVGLQSYAIRERYGRGRWVLRALRAGVIGKAAR